MRLVIDLQGAQGASRQRGIGRYSRDLALAMVRRPRGHDPVLLLNGGLEASCLATAGLFEADLPREALHVWHSVPRSAYLAGQPAIRTASERIRAETIVSLSADLLHVSSMMEGVSDDCVTAWPGDMGRLPSIATFYDAIPLIRAKDYLDGIWKPIAPWFYRHTEELRRCEGLLAISQSAGDEAVDWVGCDRLRVFDIRAGYDKALFRRVIPQPRERERVLARYGLREGFVLMVGAADPRKNDLRLIQAYAALPASLRQRHQLAIVGTERAAELRKLAGPAASGLVLIDHVADAALPVLYSLCALSVMPSEHEGFGLPALEAMACGAAVIASDTTSLPEVVGALPIGGASALFDPYSVPAITAALHRALGDADWRAALAVHGLQRAGLFGWEQTAELAWDAIEEVAERDRQARRVSLSVHAPATAMPVPPAGPLTTAHRPTLAFVSPLPPEQTGIADYACELLPELGRLYDITVVTASGTVGEPRLAALFPALSEQAFLTGSRHFDRVLYQVGNSPFHTRMVRDLLPARPGVVVLHDAYLGNLPWVELVESGDRDAYARAVFDSHGWRPLLALQPGQERALTVDWPISLPVWRDAVGVISHSRHAHDIAVRDYGEAATASVAQIPLLRGRARALGRSPARDALGVPAAFYLCCSFGIVADTKRPLPLLRAWAMAFARRPEAVLAFVGSVHEALRDEIVREMQALGLAPHRVVLTDRIDADTYRMWLNAADCAVQLREGSRGETSAAIGDCLAAGLPTIVNAHGSAAELPGDAVLLLDDAADDAALAAALLRVHDDASYREGLGRRGQLYARDELSAVRIAAMYRDAIERMWTTGRVRAIDRACVDSRAIVAPLLPDLARALVRSFPAAGPRRLLIDATNMAKLDLGTGIQRVIREVAVRAIRQAPRDWRVGTTRLDGADLLHAHRFAAGLLGLPAGEAPPFGLADSLVEAGPGDVIVLMDHHGDLSAAEEQSLRRLQLQGAQIVLVVYDILPLRHPQWFPAGIVPALQHWPRAVLGFADAALCISDAVARDVIDWLEGQPGLRRRPLRVDHFPLGADFTAVVAGEPGYGEARVMEAVRAAARRPSLLMVGTVEPRKGHAQTLAAFEQLWAAGAEIGLTIVGKQGWMMDALVARLRAHPEAGGRLHWLDKVGDADLARLYDAHAGLLMASEGEGFGLPLIEAAHHGLPIVSRDLPVFREVAGEAALYFDGVDPGALAACLRHWLDLYRDAALPDPAGIKAVGWDAATASFLRPLLGGQWRYLATPAASSTAPSVPVSGTPAAATA